MFKRIFTGVCVLALLCCGCGGSEQPKAKANNSSQTKAVAQKADMLLIKGGSFNMGSPAKENWRSKDEVQHQVKVGDFYLSKYEVSQAEYEGIMGKNPSNFKGSNLPVENLTWYEAVEFCNELSKKEGLTPVYKVEGTKVSWNRSANGYRLPTEAEWEYACRAGTSTPFYTPKAIGPNECNYYGHYPYGIESNYFNSSSMETQPGEYRETTVKVNSFEANPWGLYNMHGNVGEWVWDYYAPYDVAKGDNPAGPASGSLRVYRGGAWNDFGKHLRSAYRAAFTPNYRNFGIGLRLARNGNDSLKDTLVTTALEKKTKSGKVLLAYYSWGGTTAGVARKIAAQANADVWEITMKVPYSRDYNDVLMQAQMAQNRDERPALAQHIPNMEQYDIILLGYPNWWASIPMPIASFLEEYNFDGKLIVPFCSNGGGRFGQSLTTIAKLVPKAKLGEGLTVHYSGGAGLKQEITDWLKTNDVSRK